MTTHLVLVIQYIIFNRHATLTTSSQTPIWIQSSVGFLLSYQRCTVVNVCKISKRFIDMIYSLRLGRDIDGRIRRSTGLRTVIFIIVITVNCQCLRRLLVTTLHDNDDCGAGL